ncbi:MAG: efflux RND transporter periplasmic adaptor subunit [Alphaproteobacteria bacterium]
MIQPIVGRRPVAAGVLACFAFGIGLNLAPATAVADDAPAVDCVIHPYRVADLSSAVPGVVDEVKVKRSDAVAEGQMVASLDAGLEEATVALAKARAGVTSEVALGQVELEFNLRRKERVDWLYARRTVPFERTDDAKREQDLSAIRLQQARELVAIRKLELRRAQEQLNQKIIMAPFSGFVLEVFRAKGEYVEGQPILRLAQLDPLRVEAIVPVAFFGRIKVGSEAEIVPELATAQSLRGTVEVVDRIADAASGTFGVRLTLTNPEHRLPAGLKCELKFIAPITSAAKPADGRRTSQ